MTLYTDTPLVVSYFDNSLFIYFGTYSQNNKRKYGTEDDTVSCCTYGRETLSEKGRNVLHFFEYVEQNMSTVAFIQNAV